jgi:hypothetical protein
MTLFEVRGHGGDGKGQEPERREEGEEREAYDECI